MITLREALQGYGMLRRSLGFKFRDDARALARFVAFMEERHEAEAPCPLGRLYMSLLYPVQGEP
jgi:hypothetical protein